MLDTLCRAWHLISTFAVVTLLLTYVFIMQPDVQAQTTQPLIQQGSLQYIGAFKLPSSTLGSTWGFGSYTGCCGLGTYAVTYNPVNNSIFIGGHPYEQRIAEIAIPSSLSGTPTGNALSNLVDPLEGKLGSINPSDSNSKILASALVYNNKLYLGAYSYYDGAVTQNKSEFVRPLNLSTTGQVVGPVKIGSQYPGWVDKFVALIPQEWQSSFGGPAFAGGAGGAINSAQSWGPSVSVFNPASVGSVDPVPATLVLGYPLSNPLADTSVGNNYWSQADVVTGVVFPGGTRTVLFFGKHGKGAYCYGTGAQCGDLDDSSKGTHAYPYASWVWAYDANDLIAVKNGQKQSWQVLPYATWTLDSSFKDIQGAAYDPGTQRIYVSQVGGDGAQPLIRAYQINNTAATPTPTPTPSSSATPTPTPTPTQSSSPTPTPTPTAQGTACNVSMLPIVGTRIVNVNSESALQSAVSNAQTGDTIVIANGTYNLTNTLYLNGKNNITIRGNSGCDGVVLKGPGMDNPSFGNVQFGIWSSGLNTTIAHLTIRDTWENAIAFNAGAQSPHVYSVKMIDIGSQFIKSNPTDPANGIGVDNGIIEYSWMEYTNNPPSNAGHAGGSGYFNGMSLHTADNWIIRNNYFKNLHNPDSATAYLWNPAVLVWNHSQNTTTENNIFLNVDRAIAYGLIDQNPGTDHSDGVIRNNFITETPGLMSSSRKSGSDGLIVVNDAPNAKVYHNTILTNGNINFSIEFRFSSSTGGEARNNLADAPLNLARDGASTAQSGNLLTATQSMFVNPGAGDLHLLSGATQAINAAPALSAVTKDIDGQTRPQGSGYDIGADEYTAGGNPTPTPTPAPTPTPTATPTPSPTGGPVACSLYTPSSSIPTGFGSPYDVAFNPATNLIQTTCTTSSVNVTLGTGNALQYIYNTGYLYKTGGTNWTPVNYTSTESLISNAWYPKTANATVAMTSTELANPSYALGYLCTWTGSVWKCGCRDQACTQSYWQIQSFKR